MSVLSSETAFQSLKTERCHGVNFVLTTDDKMCPDSNVHGAKMGPNWGRQDLGGSHVGPMNFATWVVAFNQYDNVEDLATQRIIQAQCQHIIDLTTEADKWC